MTNVFDLDALREQRAAERAAERTVPVAIANCEFCDDDGYRIANSLICDHQNHRPAYEAGMAAVRAALTKTTESQDIP